MKLLSKSLFILMLFAAPALLVAQEEGETEKIDKDRAFIGVEVQTLDEDLAANNGIDISEGAFVREAMAGEPAAEAGMKHGDVITKIAGYDIVHEGDLVKVISQHTPGDEIEVVYFRDGEHHTVKVKLKSMARE